MVSLVIIIRWHGNDVCVYVHVPLFYLYIAYCNVCDIIEVISSSFILGFIMCPSIIYGNILVVNTVVYGGKWHQVNCWVWW